MKREEKRSSGGRVSKRRVPNKQKRNKLEDEEK